MKKFKFLLLDAGPIIKLFELGIWDEFISRCDITVTRTAPITKPSRNVVANGEIFSEVLGFSLGKYISKLLRSVAYSENITASTEFDSFNDEA